MNPSLPGSKRRKYIAAALAILLIIALIAVAIVLLRQPSTDDYKIARDIRVKELRTARQALPVAVNKYLAAFKAAYNKSNDADKAVSVVKTEYDAFMAAEEKATDALTALTSNRVANVGDTATTIDQLGQDYEAEITYYRGMVDSYADYTVLFSSNEDRCSGIFVGEADGLADRRAKIDAAARKCFAATEELQKSQNITYVEYAKKVERRVKQLQGYAASTAKAEVNVKEFENKLAVFQKRYAEMKARNASDKEVLALADEIAAVNEEIAENKANFDFAAKRYLSTIKGMPTLYGDVFAANVPAKQKYYEQLIDRRTSVLEFLLDGSIQA